MQTVWEEICESIKHEFSDLPSFQAVTRIVLRLIFGAALGGLLGYNREQKG